MLVEKKNEYIYFHLRTFPFQPSIPRNAYLPIQMDEPSSQHAKGILCLHFIFNQMLLNYLCVIRKVRMELLFCCTCVYECVCVRDAQCTLCILMRLILVLIFQCVDCGQPAELFVQSMLFRLFISVVSWNCQKQVQTHVFLSLSLCLISAPFYTCNNFMSHVPHYLLTINLDFAPFSLLTHVCQTPPTPLEAS